MSGVTPRDPAFEARVRASFARQTFMATLGATLEAVRPGEVVIALPFREALTQQHGFLHAGAVSAVVDSACGYAALTLMPAGAAVLSVEFKVNMLAPAAGRRFAAIGRVRKAGRTITVCEGEMRAFSDDGPAEGKLVALMQGTMMTVADRPELTD
ncbi:MAG TPA: PaaI family thioesterase [Gemmatimonadaceae bacterium]|nr:PaaI family thioesterase [Gemmatimonadaceae bacterium]